MKNKSITNSNFIKIFLMVFIAVVFCASVIASPISIFTDPANGWTQFAEDDEVENDGYVGPGSGGQKFDAEYLFYQLNNDILSIVLQTGFDLSDGKQKIDGVKYFAGDLALSFDGNIDGDNGSGYEYAVDFGLKTKDWDGDKVGLGGGYKDYKGLYSVSEWNNDLLFTQSSPFAMDGGTLIGDLIDIINDWDKEGSGQNKSYYRIASFDISAISEIAPEEAFTVHAHWTMSSGNDDIEGYFNSEGYFDDEGSSDDSESVPEPTTIALLGIGLAGLGGTALRRRLRLRRRRDADRG